MEADAEQPTPWVVVPTGEELDNLAARLFPILLPTLICSRLKIVPAIPQGPQVHDVMESSWDALRTGAAARKNELTNFRGAFVFRFLNF